MGKIRFLLELKRIEAFLRGSQVPKLPTVFSDVQIS